MTTERLHEFIILASTLNYSNAARILFITQSTLSRHIAEMEDELGFQLFERTTRNVVLTDAGKQFAYNANNILKKYDTAVNRLNIKGVKASGIINICYTKTALFPPFLNFCQKFSEKYPDIQLKMEMITGLYDVSECLSDHDIFFSPATYPDAPKNIKMFRVFAQPAFLLMSPRHRLTGNQFLRLSDIKGETLYITNDDAAIGGPFTRNAQIALKRTHGNLNVNICQANDALLNMSMSKGITILPRYQILEDYQSYPALKLDEEGCNFDINLFIDIRSINPATGLFLNELLPPN